MVYRDIQVFRATYLYLHNAHFCMALCCVVHGLVNRVCMYKSRAWTVWAWRTTRLSSSSASLSRLYERLATNQESYKKLSCRREAARCFVFVCSQLQHTYSAVFLLPVTVAGDSLVHKILLNSVLRCPRCTTLAAVRRGFVFHSSRLVRLITV